MKVVIRGTSMEPTLHDGDIVNCRKMKRYKQGDLVVIKAPTLPDDTLVVKRLGTESADGWTFYSDNQSIPTYDSNCIRFLYAQNSDIIGKVVK